MSELRDYAPGTEPERYELSEPPAYHFSLDRRDFCRLLGGGIVMLLLVEGAGAQESGQGCRPGRGGGGAPQDVAAWIHVDPEGKVTVYTGKTEVGQNIRTSLAQVVAEELRVPLDSIHMVMADTAVVPYDAGTFGSQTTPQMARQLRRAAAAARELLLDFAAEEWKTDRATLSAADGKILRAGTGDALPYGRLTQGRKLTKAIAGEPPTTPPTEWKIAGHSARKAEGRAFVTGRHKYSADVSLPRMLHGKVLRPSAFGAKLVSADTKAAEAMPGVVVVRDGDFLGVAAPTEQQAVRALQAIRAEWQTSPQVSGKDLWTTLRPNPPAPAGPASPSQEPGAVRVAQTYTVAYIAHAPLEPRAAVAQWEDGKLTVWTGTQRPFGVRGELAQAFRVPEEQVRVVVPDTGSGYGGKHTGEAAVEAARLARAAGKPVKLLWTREEEMTWAYFRPAGVIDVTGAANKEGVLTAWEHHNYNSGGSAIRTLYAVPNPVAEFHQARSPLRQGSYRGLAATANHFARETAMDELAHALGQDPLQFRLRNLQEPRLKAVLEAAAKQFGWDRKPPAGHGVGLAVGSEKGSYVATCAEVAVDKATGRVRVVRAVSAFECGAVVSPDHLKNQVEGSMIQGLGGALFEAIEFEDGKILNPRFSRYRVPRFSDTPEVEVVLVDRKDLPSAGAGETPIVCIAPAVGNALFAAAGVRLRSLPLLPTGVLRT